MKDIERKKMVAAMEFIARQINDEDLFNVWLTVGVADGDIRYGDLSGESVDDCYIEDDPFGDIMKVFLGVMKSALEDGGLYCDGVVSKNDR